MKNSAHILLAGLSVFTFGDVFADHIPHQFARNEKIESRDNFRNEKNKTQDERKQEFLAKFAASVGIGIVGGYISQRACLEGTGADVGLVISTLLMSLSCFVDGENASMLRSMAFAATPLSMISVGLSSEAISGQNGALAKYGILGVDKLFKNTTGKSKFGLLGLLTIASYIVSKPLMNEATAVAEDVCSGTFNKAKKWYRSHRN